MYDPTKEDIGEDARRLATAAHNIGERVHHELTADEDPGKFDLDDLIEVAKKSPGDLYDLFVGLSKAYANPATLEGMAHGISSQYLR